MNKKEVAFAKEQAKINYPDGIKDVVDFLVDNPDAYSSDFLYKMKPDPKKDSEKVTSDFYTISSNLSSFKNLVKPDINGLSKSVGGKKNAKAILGALANKYSTEDLLKANKKSWTDEVVGEKFNKGEGMPIPKAKPYTSSPESKKSAANAEANLKAAKEGADKSFKDDEAAKKAAAKARNEAMPISGADKKRLSKEVVEGLTKLTDIQAKKKKALLEKALKTPRTERWTSRASRTGKPSPKVSPTQFNP